MVEGVSVATLFAMASTGPLGLHFGGTGLRKFSVLISSGERDDRRRPLGAVLGLVGLKKALGLALCGGFGAPLSNVGVAPGRCLL